MGREEAENIVFSERILMDEQQLHHIYLCVSKGEAWFEVSCHNLVQVRVSLVGRETTKPLLKFLIVLLNRLWEREVESCDREGSHVTEREVM